MTSIDPRTAVVAELLGNPSVAHAVALYVEGDGEDLDPDGNRWFDPSSLRMRDGDWLDWILSAVRVHGTEEDKELHDTVRFSAL